MSSSFRRFRVLILNLDPWFKPLRECVSLASISCDELQAQGDANVAGFLSTFLMVSGLPLNLALSQLEVIRDRLCGRSSLQTRAHSYLWLRVAQRLHLAGPAGDECPVELCDGEWMSDERLTRELELDHNLRDCWMGWLTRGMAAFYEGDVRRATELLTRAHQEVNRVPGYLSQCKDQTAGNAQQSNNAQFSCAADRKPNWPIDLTLAIALSSVFLSIHCRRAVFVPLPVSVRIVSDRGRSLLWLVRVRHFIERRAEPAGPALRSVAHSAAVSVGRAAGRL